MTKKEKFTIQAINSKSPYLKQVIELGDQNSATLGLLPRIAYKKAADNENILICISSNKELVGYLFYNVNHRKNIVKLNYLCIKEEWRGQGIARLLIDKLQEKTQKLSGIALSCRRDYNLNQFWASLGFTVKSERKGRKKDGSILTEWRFDYGHDDLLTKLTQQNTESKVIAVIDSNIFFDLMDRTRFDEDSKESKALLSDWLASEVELCITDEINNEINRNEDQQQRQKLQEIANSYAFTSLVYDREKFENNCKSLSRFFPDDSKMKESDYSDLRHLAKAIASQHNVQFFITRDTRLLDEIEEDIYQKFNIRIIRPVDFIVKLDELWREAEYQPRQLAGTKLEQRKIKSQEINSTTEEFLNNAQGEKKVDFKRTLRQLLGQVELVEGFFIIRDQEKIGFIIYDRQDEF